MSKAVVDMIGRRFRRWTVLAPAEKPEYSEATARFYLCRCDCGTERVLNGRSLRIGDSRSCGCLRADLNRERIKRETAARKKARRI